eukprot:TRINITY_DN2203_c0_g1_i1.p1 TRINITY_DN2203_c0_g1~~TRINITY_DN2203_c0_g1_i1.p1  ORF type:complete len:367 (-),score=115.02 TRINITY_DN2203_c0_g1_i1:880-1980(-)
MSNEGEDESSISRIFVIQNIIKMLPTSFQRNLTDPTTLTISQLNLEAKNEKSFEEFERDEEEKIEAGTFLWDLSVIPEQSQFLESQNLVFILHWTMHSSRLLEVSLGILSNMCNVERLCIKIYENDMNGESLLNTLVNLTLSCNDSLALGEAFRLFSTRLYQREVLGEEQTIQKVLLRDEMSRRILEILEGNTNEILLERVATAFSFLFYSPNREVDKPEIIVDICGAVLELLKSYMISLNPINEGTAEIIIQWIEFMADQFSQFLIVWKSNLSILLVLSSSFSNEDVPSRIKHLSLGAIVSVLACDLDQVAPLLSEDNEFIQRLSDYIQYSDYDLEENLSNLNSILKSRSAEPIVADAIKTIESK